MVNLIEQIDSIPNFKFLCVSVLLFPLSVGLGTKLVTTDNVSFKRNDTEIKLGQIKQVVQQSDRLIESQQENIDDLVRANNKVQRAAKREKIVLPELEEVEEVVNRSEELTEELEDNSQQLKDLTEQAINEQSSEQSIIK